MPAPIQSDRQTNSPANTEYLGIHRDGKPRKPRCGGGRVEGPRDDNEEVSEKECVCVGGGGGGGEGRVEKRKRDYQSC